MGTKIRIRLNGDQARFIHNDLTAVLMSVIAESSTTVRASYVEPDGDKWAADMGPVDGPVLGPFSLRCNALKAEREWLKEHKGL